MSVLDVSRWLRRWDIAVVFTARRQSLQQALDETRGRRRK
jgi:hypothetical protein